MILFFVALHIFLITISNILVLYPTHFFTLTTTYGAYTYPFIFILSDLANKKLGAKASKSIISYACLPGLVISFVLSSWIQYGYIPWHQSMPLRIAFAGIIAYWIGQQLDILIFTPLKNMKKWWVAPVVSGVLGNMIDTFCFFFVAFYHASNTFLASHWIEIASSDLLIKMIISQAAGVPFYGYLITRKKIIYPLHNA